MGLKDRLKLAEFALDRHVTEVDTDVFKLEPDADGVVRQPCWFCKADVEFRPADNAGDAAVIMIEVFGTHEHRHGLCHTGCVDRSQGSLAL